MAKISEYARVTAPSGELLSKNNKPLKQDLFDTHHILEF